jgi:hypothetical protein
MAIINLLSTVLAWVARTYDLAPLQATLVAIMAVANAVAGLYLMLRLLREDPASDRLPEKDR